MPRTRNSVATRHRRKKVLKMARGYRGPKSKCYRPANEQVMHSLQYAYRDRRARKSDFRRLWIARINAAAREHGMSYNRFISGLKAAGVDVDRKILADLAIHDPEAFAQLVKVAQDAVPAPGKEAKPRPKPKAAEAKEEAVEEKPATAAAGETSKLPSSTGTRSWGGGSATPVASRNHQVVKRVRRLRRRTYRDRDGVFLVEGLNLLQEAVKYGAHLQELIFVQTRAEEAGFIRGLAGDKCASYVIEEGLLGWVSDVVTSQGILAVVSQVDTGYAELMEGEPITLVLVADQVRDPGNLGALMRIADAAGADGFLMTAGCADAYNPKVVRAAAGSHFHIPFTRDVDFDAVAGDLTGMGVRVLGLDAHGAAEYLDEDLAGPVALVVGNEAFGIDEGHAEKLHDSVFICMPGRAESLNVASAAAVVLFEALRQRRGGERG